MLIVIPLDVGGDNRIVGLALPKNLAHRLIVKYEGWRTLTDRDIDLTRYGDGLPASYDLDIGIIDNDVEYTEGVLGRCPSGRSARWPEGRSADQLVAEIFEPGGC